VTRARSQGGFSLIELAVSLVVIGLVLALAAQLLGEAQLTFVTVARENRTSAPAIALQWLRQDLRAARSVGGGASWVPSSGPLELLRGQGWIVYQLEGESLRRTAYDLSNLPGPARPILGDVVSWSWRRPSSGLVEVTVLQREPLARLLRVRADLARPASETHALRLTIAQRGQAVGW
jgi:prepilin-type N-terminal cleavage/methylation domain-containing protein